MLEAHVIFLIITDDALTCTLSSILMLWLGQERADFRLSLLTAYKDYKLQSGRLSPNSEQPPINCVAITLSLDKLHICW